MNILKHKYINAADQYMEEVISRPRSFDSEDTLSDVYEFALWLVEHESMLNLGRQN